jgi:hypothetical protein
MSPETPRPNAFLTVWPWGTAAREPAVAANHSAGRHPSRQLTATFAIGPVLLYVAQQQPSPASGVRIGTWATVGLAVLGVLVPLLVPLLSGARLQGGPTSRPGWRTVSAVWPRR